jgi:F-type H+-transporting ATPase subunit epsilon
MATTLKLEIVTPEAVAFSDEVDLVTLPGVEGEMGIYPMHTPLMTQIVPGEMMVRKGAQEFFLAVGDGFAEVTGDHVSILTDMAILADNIDAAKAEEARRRAEARLNQKISAEEVATVNGALAHALAQLQVKRRHRH